MTSSSVRDLARRGRRRLRRARARWETRSLSQRERATSKPLIGDAPVVVSLTSYGTRIDSVHVTIESIARGAVRPARIVLWLDSADAMANLPEALERQKARGLEVRLAENYGPHTKYFPFVQADDLSGPLVTADDDILYPRHWLAGLMDAHTRHPDAITGYWVRTMRLGDSGIPTGYASWPSASDTLPHPRNVPLGVSGVIYPPRMLERLRELGEAFVPLVPSTDDLWLHAVALRAGIEVRQLNSRPVHFLTVPGSQQLSLAATNVSGSGNDRAVARLYTRGDLQLIEGLVG
ncbi:hypothetical protein [Agreia sp. COWG]|uniref:hypothetical protein n=1 Tax=Agreia sp. COWG TaxID=2773266 RepID=UPI00192699EA|nr:hypothetical protein [Agreia sp. COWG]CAD5991107.1 conserved protein of unknown function [Agreia sp. COWG]